MKLTGRGQLKLSSVVPIMLKKIARSTYQIFADKRTNKVLNGLGNLACRETEGGVKPDICFLIFKQIIILLLLLLIYNFFLFFCKLLIILTYSNFFYYSTLVTLKSNMEQTKEKNTGFFRQNNHRIFWSWVSL